MITQTISIKGMHCQGCVASVTRALRGLDGVADVQVSLADSQARISYDEAVQSAEKLVAAVEGAGFEAQQGE